MKKVFWIFACCALSVSMAFSQDDNYYDNSVKSVPPDNYNNYKNESATTPAPVQDNNTAPAPADNNSSYIISPNDPNDQAYNNNSDQAYNNSTSNDNSNNTDNQNYQTFHDQLSPYGNWIYYPGYGNVWVPTQVPSDFSPYVTAGHWVNTDYGWTWVSNYAWGGVPFHYGRWFRDAAYGWMWMPGYQWAPAWVSWGSYDNYYCWAPLAPFVNYFSYRPVYGWNFCAREHFCEGNLGFYLANRSFYGRGDYRSISAHINMMNETRTYGNRSYFSGPRVNEVERATGHSISVAHINSANHNNFAPHNNSQFHQQNNVNHQSFENHSTAQANHYSNNNVQHAQQQFNRLNTYATRPNYNNQSQRSYSQTPNMARGNYQSQHFSQPSHQSYNSPQRSYSYQRSQPVQRQSERNFASAQRFSSSRGGTGSHGRR